MSIEATLIAPDQLAALQATEPVVVIDTRDADTFAAGHVPGAGAQFPHAIPEAGRWHAVA